MDGTTLARASRLATMTLGPQRALDRMSARRADAAFVSSLHTHPDSRFALLLDLKPVMVTIVGRSAAALRWLTPAEVEALGVAPEHKLFLGVEASGAARFAITLDEAARASAAYDAFTALSADARELRALAIENLLAPEELSLAGEARALAEWHRNSRCCGHCGTLTAVMDGGWRRHCYACVRDHFPRTDPVVIMLVTEGDCCLVARAPRFSGRMFSALAGFLEPGEDIEHAVAREVKEEVGLDVTDVSYIASQPWPFPHTLMIGCLARATSRSLTLDPAEIAEAFWADRAAIRRMFAGVDPDGNTLPAPYAIAHTLVRHWLGDAD